MSKKELPKNLETLIEHCGHCRNEAKELTYTSDKSQAAFFCSASFCPVFKDGERPAGVLLTADQAKQIKLFPDWRKVESRIKPFPDTGV